MARIGPFHPPRRSALLVAALTALAVTPTIPAYAAPDHGASATSATTKLRKLKAALELAGAHWIWYPEGSPAQSAPAATRYLRRTFTLPAGAITDADFTVTGDDTVDVWVNGRYLAGSTRAVDSWKRAFSVDITAALKPGASNTIAVAARNTTAGPAGILGKLHIGSLSVVTDASWQAAKDVGEDWTQSTAAWPAAADLGAYGIAPWNADVTLPIVGSVSPLTPAGLTVERRDNPVGVGTGKPRFGWRVTTDTRAQVQGSYQLQVSKGPASIWDTGKVASNAAVDITYGGPALVSNAAYTWRVRVWDGQGRPSPWSTSGRFDTGLLNPAAEWDADFIGSPTNVNLTGASWIWYPEGDPANNVPIVSRYFRRTFNLGTVSRSTLVVTGDDTADVWVNGTKVSTSPREPDSWKNGSTVDVTAQLRTGANTIAIASDNTSVSPAGVIAKLTSGSTTIVTDTAWKASQSNPAGWEQPSFNDSAWPAAVATSGYGSGPWGSGVTISSAAPYLRKGFAVSKPVARARLFATALGLHDTYLNGARVGDERLAPGWTDYNKRLQYRTHDVTDAIRQGDNALAALVGNGWYSGNIGFAGSQRYGTSPWYSARLVIEYTDGTSSVVSTDGTWRTATGAVTANDLYQGEDQDARKAIAGWNTPGFNDAAWATATVRTGAKPNLVAQVDPGVTVQQEFRPVSITQPKPGVWIADLGQNFAGWNRVKATGPAGTRITMRHGEILNGDGTLYTANLRAARATDTFILAGTGAAETFEPRFTQHGYRYVELTGFPGTPTADSLTGLAAWTDGAETGTFNTSDPLVNQLQHNILWGARSNMLSVPSDCPQRDERLGWTGDIAAFANTSTFGFDVHGLLTKFVDDMVDAQRADGAYTDVAPAVLSDAGRAGWGDAGVVVPYTLWQRYGDLRAADQHFDSMVRWVEYLRGTAGADLIRDQWTHGDWLNVDDNTANNLTSTAYFGWSARLLSRMAAATGRTAEAATYGSLADRIGAAFTAKFVAADGTVSGNTQTGYVLPLAFGLIPDNRIQSVADKLAAKVASRNGHLSVGFMGVQDLLPVLAEHGHLATAYQILQQPDYPGWGYMNSRGATTIWERWDGIRTDGSLQDVGMNSFNHYGLGSVGDWLYRTVGGVAPAAPGYQRALIAPKPGGTLTSASSALTTAYGPTRSEWSRNGAALTLRVTVPPNTTATVRVPAASAGAVSAPPEATPQGYAGGAASYSLGSGSYTFTVSG